ncbi:MAG: DUF4372 domain-containing protein [Deltaproteobacteria bacterium]|nr:DUF4372 domain-containing protein [Deltaproteobacteria bacterium]
MAQPTVFSQVVELVPRTEFEAIVARHDGDARVRSLDCWTWFGSLSSAPETGPKFFAFSMGVLILQKSFVINS